jgi:glycine betaine/proline transport system substrate-binding protein
MKITIGIFIILVSLNNAFAAKLEMGNKEKEIVIILNNWPSQLVLSNIVGKIFIGQGYKVKYKEYEIKKQWGALRLGEAHVQVEVWESTYKKHFDQMVLNNQIIDVGSYDIIPRTEWWYPQYVEKLCPGLPNWTALKKCSAIFATEDTFPQGRYLASPWRKPDRARIRALNLDFKVIEVKNVQKLGIELEKSIAHKKPILLYNWTPNWVEIKYKGNFIEFPNYEPECETDPKWGINKSLTHDCGDKKDTWLKRVAWVEMPKNWPKAYNFLKNMKLNNEILSTFSYLVNIKKLSPSEAADFWLKENKDIWEKWSK